MAWVNPWLMVFRHLPRVPLYILRGPSADHVNNPYFKQAMLSISQHLMFNTTIRSRSESSSSYHSTGREPSIAVYLAQLIHSHTRKLNIVDSLCHLGLCISGDRLLDISASMGNRTVQEGRCSFPLKFTTWNVHNNCCR